MRSKAKIQPHIYAWLWVQTLLVGVSTRYWDPSRAFPRPCHHRLCRIQIQNVWNDSDSQKWRSQMHALQMGLKLHLISFVIQRECCYKRNWAKVTQSLNSDAGTKALVSSQNAFYFAIRIKSSVRRGAKLKCSLDEFCFSLWNDAGAWCSLSKT